MASPKNKEPQEGAEKEKKMAEKITRKDLFARIAETMKDDHEVVEMCEKYIAQLSKPRRRWRLRSATWSVRARSSVPRVRRRTTRRPSSSPSQ